MTRGRMKREMSPVHRISLTHGRIPKFIREDTEQFFAAAMRRRSKIMTPLKPIELQQSYQAPSASSNGKQKENSQLTIPKPIIPVIVPSPSPSPPPPPQAPVRTASSRRTKGVSSASLCNHQPTLPPIIPSPSSSLEFSTPLLESLTSGSSLNRPFHHGGPIDQDVFRKAYERALSVARSRLLFRDPYSLTRASATHGVLYSYYDHTPMCIFSRGTACNHRQDPTMKSDRKIIGNVFRKKIFDDVIVEQYIPYGKKLDLNSSR